MGPSPGCLARDVLVLKMQIATILSSIKSFSHPSDRIWCLSHRARNFWFEVNVILAPSLFSLQTRKLTLVWMAPSRVEMLEFFQTKLVLTGEKMRCLHLTTYQGSIFRF